MISKIGNELVPVVKVSLRGSLSASLRGNSAAEACLPAGRQSSLRLLRPFGARNDTSLPANPPTNCGFTLVELMVSVVILGFGLSIVIQSFMSALAGLNTNKNMVESMVFAQKKIEELTEDSYKNNGSLPESDSGVVKLGKIFFNWKTEISEIEEPEYLSGNFVAAGVSVDWKERNIAKNTALAIYLPKRKE